MGRKKKSARPEGKKAKRPNMIAAAVELAGGPSAVAELRGVISVNRSIADDEMEGASVPVNWRYSRASGIPIEKLAAEPVELDNTAKPRNATIRRIKPDSE